MVIRFATATILGLAFVVMLFSGGASAGGRGLYQVIGWYGNEFLFEVQPDGPITRLTGYRALGSRWEKVGYTTIRAGQRVAEQGFLQKIWFKGRRLYAIDADMNNPYWRVFPGLERHGGGGRVRRH